MPALLQDDSAIRSGPAALVVPVRLARSLMGLLLSIMFVGAVPIEQATGVIADLRALAVKVGCPEAQVRTKAMWAGAGWPAVIEVDCPGPARAPAAAPVPSGLIEEPAP